MDLLENKPRRPIARIVLAHGAGAAMDSPFMDAMAKGLEAHGIWVTRFEFPYMARRRQSGSRSAPDRGPVLQQTWLDVIGQCPHDKLIIGGKSMGGRIASMVADQAGIQGLICLGYPFHPTGKPDQLRTEHFKTIATPTLILQGERDPFGNRQEVESYRLSKQIEVHWLIDGDHGFKPRKSSGHTEQENWREAINAMADFARAL